MTWDVILSMTTSEPLVGCRWRKIFFRICRSGISFSVLLKIPPISNSEEEETTVMGVLRYVNIGPFGLRLPL